MSSTVTVSNSVQLTAALKAAATATSPETIILAAGTYSTVNIWKYNPAATVTIQSANSSNKADIQGLSIQDSSNFTFNDVTFTDPTTNRTGNIATSYNNNKVNFLNDSFLGSSTSYASAPEVGLVVGGSTNTTISGSQFHYVQNGIGQDGNNVITMSDNTFSNIFGDGIDNAGSSNVHITNNTFTNMHIDSADGQHSDAIQFWTTGHDTAGSNITITGNAYNIGTGEAVQGIFMTVQTAGLAYSNVTIENNVMVGTGWNGLTLQDVHNATVENNTLQTVSSTGQISRLSLDGGVTGLIENNKIGAMVKEGVNTATVAGNSTVAAISLSAAQSLVSGMASVTSTSGAATGSSSTAQLAQYDAYLAAHPLAAKAA